MKMIEMTSREKESIKILNERLSTEICIRLELTNNEQSGALTEFCRTLTGLAPRIKVNSMLLARDGQPPAIQVHDRFRFHGVPMGTELDPFLEALAFLGGKPVEIPDQIRAGIDGIRTPAALKLYIARHCPHCPIMAGQIISLAFASEFIDLAVIDGTMFPELAASDRIMSAPTLLFNNNTRWTGLRPLADIVGIISTLDPDQLSASALEGIIKEGNASHVASMMLKSGKVFPGVLDLLVHEKWPVRLGAVVAVEHVAEKDTGLASRYIEPLLERLPSSDDPVLGDALYVFGLICGTDDIPRIASLLQGRNNTELNEAFQEAVEKIHSRAEKLSQ